MKTTINVRNLKPLSLFVIFFAQACKRIFIKTHSTESRCYRTGKYTVRRRVRISFSPEILQVSAVKGLTISCSRTLFTAKVRSQTAGMLVSGKAPDSRSEGGGRDHCGLRWKNKGKGVATDHGKEQRIKAL